MGGSAVDIKGFVETSFTDWPGKVAAVVFLPRCNYRCPYCHNHALVTDPERYQSWPLSLILGRLERLRGWADGVCVTGGEPTVSAGLGTLLRTLRGEGWQVKLDTNGSRPDVLREFLSADLFQAVSLDIKAPLEPIPYRRNGGAGADPEPVRQTLQLLAGAGLPVETRTTVHPSLLSLEECIRLRRQTAQLLGREKVRHTWQRCRVDDPLEPALRESVPLTPADFESWKAGIEGAALTEGASSQ